MNTTIVPPAVVEPDEPQAPRPSRAPKPDRARAEPLVTVRRPTARPSLPVRLAQSLVAPPLVVPLTRGVGVLAAALTATAVGLIDGVTTATREDVGMPLGARALVVAHCVAVYLLVGLLWGACCDAVLHAGSRVLPARALVAWVLDGPRRWFAPDPRLTHRTLLGLIALAAVLGATFPASLLILSRMHSKPLIALAVTLVVGAMVPVALVLVVVVARPLRWVLDRAGRLASPAGALVALSVLAASAVACTLPQERSWAEHLPWGEAEFTVALLAVDLAALCVFGAWRRRVRRPFAWRAIVAALALMALAGAASSRTLGRRQAVAVAVSTHSTLASATVYGLQRVFDLDRDGRSAVFNGGDCDDTNPAVHPGLRDVPGNGLDEDCSGRDAVALHEESDGGYAPVPAALGRARPSFVLFTVDTLRPDHLGAYGYRRPTSPRLDAFAQRAARFERAYTTSPRTLRALASIWTGRYPSHVAWGLDNNYPALEEGNATLAEQLRDAGYATAAFCDTDHFHATAGFFQGYEAVYEGTDFKSDPRATVAAFEAWLGARDASDAAFFAWMHLIEPHLPYRRLPGSTDFGPAPVDRYDAEVARADEALGRALRAIDAYVARHPARPVVVIVTADHGEALGEQGRTAHGFDLHEESVRIPLFVSAPGVTAGPRRALASLVDVHATVLNLAGLSPQATLQGQSLVAPLTDAATPLVGGRWRERLFTEITPNGLIPYEQKVIYRPPWKLLWDVRAGTWELFNLDVDRRELRNLYEDRPDVADDLREELLAWTHETWRSGRDALLAAARLRSLPAMERRLAVRFGDVMELVGYDVPARQVPAGGSIRVTLYLRALAPSQRPLRLVVQFEPEDGTPAAPDLKTSHYPVQGYYRTTEWAPGELLRDQVVVHVRERERSVRMRMRFNVVEEATLRAVAPDRGTAPDGAVSLGEVEIVGQSPSAVSHEE